MRHDIAEAANLLRTNGWAVEPPGRSTLSRDLLAISGVMVVNTTFETVGVFEGYIVHIETTAAANLFEVAEKARLVFANHATYGVLARLTSLVAK